MLTQLLEPAQRFLVLAGARFRLLLLFLIERGHRPFQPLGRAWIGRGVLAQDVYVATKPSPSGHHLARRLRGGGKLLELRGERLEAPGSGVRQQPTTLAVLERAGGVLETAGERRRILGRHRRQAVPLHLELGDAIHGVLP